MNEESKRGKEDKYGQTSHYRPRGEVVEYRINQEYGTHEKNW